MPSGDVWLHPLHNEAIADAMTFTPVSMQMKLTNGQELHSFVSELAVAQHGESANSGHDAVKNSSLIWRVSLGCSGMMITREGEARVHSQVSVPLFFSELVHTSAGRQPLIAIGRRDDRPEVGESMEKNRRSLAGLYKEVWVLSVDGDDDALHSILGAMSVLGAIRSDLHSMYKLSDSPIGAGGCSAVYLGKHVGLGVKTDLTQTVSDGLNKEMPDAIAAKVFKLRPDHRDSEVVAAEASHLLAVRNHPNIVSYYGTFTTLPVEIGAPLGWVIALEWCSIGDLHDYLAKFGACNETHAAETLIGLLAALAHVHSCGIVHRDVKAGNVLLAEGGRPMLADFGIAARADDEQAMMHPCGSPGHAAPEIILGQKYGCKVDVFSAGVVLYLMLYATLPFTGPDLGIVLRRSARANVKFPSCSGHVSNDMKKVILQLLQKEPENRIDSKSALCLMWSGWCRDRVLPQWLRNRDQEFLGSSPSESESSSQVERAAHNSPSSSKESSRHVLAGAAFGVMKADIMETSVMKLPGAPMRSRSLPPSMKFCQDP